MSVYEIRRLVLEALREAVDAVGEGDVDLALVAAKSAVDALRLLRRRARRKALPS